MPIADVGLRLEDVEAMGLEPEAVKVDNGEARRGTLEEHGATEKEIEFLTEPDDDGLCRRVELNAMTSRQLVDFVEAKLEERGAKKVLPDHDTIRKQARRTIEQVLGRKALAEVAGDIAQQVENIKLPADAQERMRELLDQHPEIPWDQAIAQIVGRL